MNANKLADDLDNANGFQYIAQLGLASQAATMLRQQQVEIEALKEKVKQNADLNEKVYLCKKKLKPIVWMAEVEGGTMYTNYEYPESIPLYIHPADTIPYKDLHQMVKNVLAHPVKEQDTDCQYCKQGCIRCDARKQLTDEEINDAWKQSHEDGIAMQQGFTTQQHYFAHLILRKAGEK